MVINSTHIYLLTYFSKWTIQCFKEISFTYLMLENCKIQNGESNMEDSLRNRYFCYFRVSRVTNCFRNLIRQADPTWWNKYSVQFSLLNFVIGGFRNINWQLVYYKFNTTDHIFFHLDLNESYYVVVFGRL